VRRLDAAFVWVDIKLGKQKETLARLKSKSYRSVATVESAVEPAHSK
jgi:hypothetical protein